MKKYTPILLALLVFTAMHSQTINITSFATGFSSPLGVHNAGDERLFVIEQNGVIKILNPDGTTNATPFLNISSIVNGGGERGLLGLAFHPDYANNGYFYVHYSDLAGDTQISRFSVDPGNPDIADAGSELEILNVNQPASNHNGGSIVFGTDGYLYIALGDGGGGGDTDNNAQNKTLLIGKLLRIDIDNPDGGNNYGIPADNPFVGDPNGRDEIWAYGLRNPYRISIDDENENIWIGDVGQNAVEEVNRVAQSEAGVNYGWRCYEGSDPFNLANCPDASELTFPVAEYSWNAGGSVIGGYVYHGAIYADLQDVYIFADLDGMIGTVDNSLNFINHGNYPGTWVGFGEDINEELYIVSITGTIYKIEGGVVLNNQDFTEAQLSITPNPASQSIRLELDNTSIATIEIFNILGSRMITASNLNSSSYELDIQSLSSGMYLVKVASEKGSITKKLIVN